MNEAARGRASLVAWWLLPSLLCLILHWHGFLSWFRADDFAWFGLTPTVHSFHDLLIALFQPRAQGTIRPWSERAFFMAGYTLFGLNSLPYRIVIFATQFADLALVAWIGRRLTGSPAAGFAAAILWVVNSGLVEPLGWACVYNEVMCAGFLLLAFYFLLRHIDTGAWRFYWYQCIVFLLGFGALEMNVVYPALAAAYTFLCARPYFRRTLPLFAVSAAYTVVHNLAAPVPTTGAYALHFGRSMIRTLLTLWSWSVGPPYHAVPFKIVGWIVPAAVAIVSLALLGFVASRWRGGIAIFFLLWYLITVAPVLPLSAHVTEYYVFIPVIGLCWLGGWALIRAWQAGVPARVGASALLLLYGLLQIPHLYTATEWNYHLTLRVRDVIEGVAGARQLHPGDSILLYGMDSDMFWNVMRGQPFRLLGIDRVYLAPGSAQPDVGPEPANWDEFIMPGEVVTRELARNRLVVYDVRGERLRNMTSLYAALPRDNSLPRRLDVGDPLIANLLGPEWYPLDQDHRWMARAATLKLGGPASAGQSLYLHGNCADQQIESGALNVTVTVDGSTLPVASVRQTSFELRFPLPPQVVGKSEIQVSIQVDRTFRPPADGRDLGLAFGVVEIR